MISRQWSVIRVKSDFGAGDLGLAIAAVRRIKKEELSIEDIFSELVHTGVL